MEPHGQPGAGRVLVTDDDVNVRALLVEILESAGYSVDTARDGKEALDKILRAPPSLVLLDVEMPVLNGWEVVRRLKEDPILQHVPVLLLTSLSQAKNKVQGMDLGADDYLTKPFNVGELLARVRGALRRSAAGLEANPLTRLPGNNAIERELAGRISECVRFAVLYFDLNNFKAFNDRYGFFRGDRVIQGTAQIIVEARQPGDFVGHVGGDDFVAVTLPERAEDFCRRVVDAFDGFVGLQYDPGDRERGYIDIPDRLGNPCRYPVMGIAIGGVTNERRPITSVGQVSELGAEMKKFAKRAGRSDFKFDRRTE